MIRCVCIICVPATVSVFISVSVSVFVSVSSSLADYQWYLVCSPWYPVSGIYSFVSGCSTWFFARPNDSKEKRMQS